jgi:hypothetical protein
VVESDVVLNTGVSRSNVCTPPVGVDGFERDLRNMSKNVGVVGGRDAFFAVTVAAKSEEEGFE